MARDTRQRILDAALACFAEHGIEGTTVAHLRARSGASTGSLYHHFPSKEDLAVAVYLEGLASYQSGVLGLLEAHPTGADGVRAIVLHHLGWVAAHPALARYLLHTRRAEQLAAATESLEAQNRAFLRQVFAWVRGRIEAGELRDLPPDVFLPLVLGPCHEFVRHALAGRMRTTLDQAASPLADGACRAVCTP